MKGAGSTRVRDAQLGMRQRRSHQKSLHRQMRSVRIWGPAGRVTANGRAERKNRYAEQKPYSICAGPAGGADTLDRYVTRYGTAIWRHGQQMGVAEQVKGGADWTGRRCASQRPGNASRTDGADDAKLEITCAPPASCDCYKSDVAAAHAHRGHYTEGGRARGCYSLGVAEILTPRAVAPAIITPFIPPLLLCYPICRHIVATGKATK